MQLTQDFTRDIIYGTN